VRAELTRCEYTKSVFLVRYDPKGRPVYSQTAIYASGVGLGASKGKEVGKYQEGYAGYVNMAKDSVSHSTISTTLIADTFVL
jgi:hypothetical protein